MGINKNILISIGFFIVLIGAFSLGYFMNKNNSEKEIESGTIKETTTELESESETEEVTTEAETEDPYKVESAGDAVANINIGWNLGNALDACGNSDYSGEGITKEIYYETLWGNPLTSDKVIDMVAQMGYGAVRIPVTFKNHIDDFGNVDEKWLERIEHLVDVSLENNMYCIIDVHHDTGSDGWIKADMENFENKKLVFKRIWEQVSETFMEYDERLIFEGYNEILDNENQWGFTSSDSYKAANLYNQLFVNTVRESGGYNKDRNLIVNTYAASGEQANIAGFALPVDTTDDHLIVGVHYYGENSASQDVILERMYDVFIKNNIPAIIGEHGTTFYMEESKRISNIEHFVTEANKYGIPVFWWDDGNYKNEVGARCNYSILDRTSLQWYSKELAEKMIEAANEK